MHAQLETHWEFLPEDPSRLYRMGGFARIKTALDENRRAAKGAVFTVDGGDTFQGSARKFELSFLTLTLRMLQFRF
jgi:2',3'-cyclic-nucleotide 2'-phosphodiesterase (5'-nucleotidase family)